MPLLARPARLRRELERALPERPFAIRLWDGSELPATSPDAPTFTVRSPRAVAQLMRAPGELGLGRAYVTGRLDVDDMDALIALIGAWEPPDLSAFAYARLLAAGALAGGLAPEPPRPAAELAPRGERHSRERDARAVRHHYDVGNDFFALFLDESMTYSCAIFSRGARTLEEAQREKLELVCRKLELRPGERVVDIGCGWGSFAIHAAREHGVSALGITLSEPQAALARERAQAAGVSDRVSFRVMDYRELEGERFDAVASIGMVEHVGEERIDLYAERLASLLGDGGRLLNHGIAQLTHGPENEAGDFSERFVFPDGAPLPLSRVQLALERAGFGTEHVEGFPGDYAETITHWIERFEERYEDAVRIGGAERARVWRLYLRAARHGFLAGHESIYQVRARLGIPRSIGAPAAGAFATAGAGDGRGDVQRSAFFRSSA